MAYIAYYRRKLDGYFAVRVITRGFSCTRSELAREIATRCGAVPETLQWAYIDGSTDTSKTLEAAVKGGFVVDSETSMV